MGADTLGALILWLIALAIVVVVAVYLLRWLYRRSTKQIAFVRTGLGGEKMVISGGAFVIPVLHEITPVGMNVMRIEVARRETHALITRDRIRVDAISEFFVKVGSGKEAVSRAAQTLGARTLEPDGLRDLLEGRFASAMRTAAAQMTLEELHEQRQAYAEKVKQSATDGLALNGLELESVAIVELDQTNLEFFDSSNAFDAQGLTQLTELIEARRRMRNEIEQRTQIEIRTQNLDAQRKALAIERETEYARLEQEHSVELRRTAQRVELAKDRATRDREAEQAQIAAREEVEKSRIAQDLALAEARIQHQEDVEQREITRRRAVDEAEIRARESTEKEQIALGLALEKARIEREREQQELEVERRRKLDLAEIGRQIAVAAKNAELAEAEGARTRAEIAASQEVETTRLQQQRMLDQARIERERLLDALSIGKRQAFEEAEISSAEEIERARIATERGLAEARLARDGDLKRLEIEKDKAIEIAELQSAIEVARKTGERSAAQADAEEARAAAIAAEESAISVRERAIAHRRKETDLIAATRDNEREALRLTSKADAEKRAAEDFGEAQRIAAQAEADAERIKAAAAATRFEVEAKGAQQINEAENVLNDAARQSRLRSKLLEKIEGIVRESVRPMEKIEAIKILHVDGVGGSGSGGSRNVTDEVIDSALRYRVQAPMIDSLMKEIGIEGGGLGRMTEVLRDAKDIQSLVSKKNAAASADDRDDERR
ncbi:MAG TPA: flotillin domain-containing protein [Roseiarcus sp.]